MKNKDQTNIIFTQEQIYQFVGLYNILKKIHNRLIKEGYIIKDDVIIPPDKGLDKDH
jgi:hypothetical protein